ncbi:MAG: hypothetical protein Q9196_000713 [Gyalolechia fulgens]
MEKRSFSEPTYQWQEYVENLEGYHHGGYHPVRIGDLYSDGRYRIVHKLGFGSYSTVWLALDQSVNRYVAMKIIVAEASEESVESRILRYLRDECDEQDKKSTIIPALLDEIWINGPNGRHLCLVTEPAGCDIATSKEDHPWIFPLTIARAIAAQTMIGLRSIHCKGIIHGNLHLRNFLLTLPPVDGLSVDAIYARYNLPRETPVHRADGRPLGPEAPPYTVMPAQLYVASIEVSDPRIRIIDFGEAWLSTDTQPKGDLQTPILYLPPETTFAKDSISFPADIWTLACSAYEILGESVLFEGFFPDRDDVIAEMVSCLGPLPQDWWDSWKAGGEFFVQNGIWRTEMTRAHSSVSRPLASRIQDMGRQADPDFSTAEAKSLEKIVEQYAPI